MLFCEASSWEGEGGVEPSLVRTTPSVIFLLKLPASVTSGKTLLSQPQGGCPMPLLMTPHHRCRQLTAPSQGLRRHWRQQINT